MIENHDKIMLKNQLLNKKRNKRFRPNIGFEENNENN